MRRIAALPLAVVLVLAPAEAAGAQEGAHSENMSAIGNIPYEARNGEVPNYGTDIEFATINGRDYAFAGSYRNGMHIVDISDPANAEVVGIYDCGITQGDVQVFRQADEPGRVFATYTSDTYGDGTSPCYTDAEQMGFDVHEDDGSGRNGTFIVDVTDPGNPRTLSFAPVAQGSHNQTVHPSGDYMYNSNSDLMTSLLPAIEIFDISDPRAPRSAGELALPTRPGLGTESHDITFSDDGTRAYSAALSQGVIIDTTRPGAPEVVSSFVDPAINVWHQSDPVTVGDREYLFVEDEFAGAAGGPVCPSGGFHIYDITGENERDPKKVGYWNIDEVRATSQADDTCTAHVFDIHQDEGVMTVAYYNGGVRVVDISGLADGSGLRQIGFYRHGDADTWSAKTPRIESDGSFFLYGNDIDRGLDIYRFDPGAAESDSGGVWLGPEAAAELPAAPAGTPRLACLLPQ